MKNIKVVLVDRKDNIVGYKEKFETHKNPVPLHRAISVVIFDKTGGKMLIHKRSKLKKTWPLFWTNPCCTNVRPEETHKESAERRLKEEMGIRTSLSEKFKFIYEAKYDETWGEHEFDHVFVGRYSGKVNPDSDEVSDYKWIEIDKLKKDIKENPEKYTPWFKMILGRLEI